jgi:UDP-glucuronate 4-epimerase
MAHTYSHLFGLPTTGLRFFTVYGPCLSRGMRSKFQREGRPDMALFLFTKAILAGQPIKVFNNGNMVRDFTYVDDIVEGVTRVIDNPPAQKNVQGTNFSSSQEEYSADRRREVVYSDGVVATDAAPTPQHNVTSGPHESSTDASQSSPSGELEGAPYKIYNIGNSSPVPLMEYIAAIETALGTNAQKEFLPMQPGDVPRTEADVTDLVENLGYKPHPPVQKGIGEFIKWYKSYFKMK